MSAQPGAHNAVSGNSLMIRTEVMMLIPRVNQTHRATIEDLARFVDKAKRTFPCGADAYISEGTDARWLVVTGASA